MNIASKLPFFVDTIFNNVFITGDSPSILVRAAGTDLSPAADVNYRVVMTDVSGGSKSFQATGKASSLTEIPLGALAAGNAAIVVQAEAAA